jgi:hypothetical protein
MFKIHQQPGWHVNISAFEKMDMPERPFDIECPQKTKEITTLLEKISRNK